MNEIEYGLCCCGCGQRTNIAKQTNKKWGHIKGQPVNFLSGHHVPKKENHHRWNNGKFNKNGYIYNLVPNHPHAEHDGYVLEHRLIAEKVVGEYLSEKVVVHHIDNNRANNEPSNLVVCQDSGYHMLIHRRQRALEACGHANWVKCYSCGEWDDPENMYINGRNQRHRSCCKA